MRILFVPNAGAVIPHLVPLLALDGRLAPQVFESAFLAPARFHASLRKLGKQVLDIDYRAETAFRAEMAACSAFEPEVIVDDFSMVTLLTSSVAGVPRVTIARTGAFPGGTPRSENQRHSCESIGRFDFDSQFKDCEAFCGVPTPRTFADVCAGHVGIIPGIPSIEMLPADAAGHQDFFFAGPLNVPDHMIPRADEHVLGCSAAAMSFFDRHQDREIAFVTLGSVLAAGNSIREAVLQLLDSGIAVISTVQMLELSRAQSDLFHHAPFVQMDAVCSRVSLMIHHCGSGTYQYAIAHGLPSICIGSGFYDRDDVARRLDELGVAKHIPVGVSGGEFMERFHDALALCRDRSGGWNLAAMRKLEALKHENDRTSESFDLEAALRSSIEMCEFVDA